MLENIATTIVKLDIVFTKELRFFNEIVAFAKTCESIAKIREANVRVSLIVRFCNYSFWAMRTSFIVFLCFCMLISLIIVLTLRRRATSYAFVEASFRFFFSSFSLRLSNDDKTLRDDKRQERDNRRQREMFLETRCEKTSNFACNWVFEIDLRTREMRRIWSSKTLETFLEISLTTILLSRDVMIVTITQIELLRG